MSKFVQAITLEPLAFKGETITATVKPIKRKLYSQLLPVMLDIKKIRDENPDADQAAFGQDARVQAAMGRAVDIAAPELAEYIAEFKGPTDADGKPVPLATVLEAAYFFEVALYLVMGVLNTANVQEGAAGESARPSAA